MLCFAPPESFLVLRGLSVQELKGHVRCVKKSKNWQFLLRVGLSGLEWNSNLRAIKLHDGLKPLLIHFDKVYSKIQSMYVTFKVCMSLNKKQMPDFFLILFVTFRLIISLVRTEINKLKLHVCIFSSKSYSQGSNSHLNPTSFSWIF